MFFLWSLQGFSQHFSLSRCLQGESYEDLKSVERLSPQSYLLYVRSNSNTADFINTDSSGVLPHSWLFKMDGEGSVIWKKIIPNTQNALYAKYELNFFLQYNVYYVADYPYPIYTKLDDELILHYSYYDSLSALVNSGGSIMDRKNNLLTFGILNSSDGGTKVEPIVIDTLIRVTKSEPVMVNDTLEVTYDTSVNVNACYVVKQNDSIYQLLVNYDKVVKIPLPYNFSGTHHLNLYTINTHSRNVIKTEYGDSVVLQIIAKNGNNRGFYWTKFAANTDSIVYIQKTDAEGHISKSKLLNINSGIPVFNYYKILDTQDELLMGGIFRIPTSAFSFTTENIMYRIKLDDLSFTTYNYSNHVVADDYQSSFNSVTSDIDNFFPNSFYKKTDNDEKLYAYLNQSYKQDSQYINLRSLVKLNENTNSFTRVTGMHAGVMDIDSIDDATISTKDSTYNGPLFMTLHHNTIQKQDTSGQIIWESQLPDSIVEDSTIVYYASSAVLNYYPVDYHHQSIVAATYIDTSDQNYYYVRFFYFLVSKETGSITKLDLPQSITPHVFDLYPKSPITFFNTSDNKLSAIAQATDVCLGNSDVAIYTYNDVVNSVQPLASSNNHDFIVYPNPADNAVYMEFGDVLRCQDATIRIIDISGKTVLSKTLATASNYMLDVNSLKSGMYFIQLQTSERNITKKLEVIH